MSTNALCCDCTCTDGLEPCAHFIVEDREATNCEAVCTDTCATVDECAGVDTSETCGGTPPPTGFNDLLCNAMCNRIYDQCNLTLADEDGLPIPTDQCDRFCQNEVIPIPALSCLSQIPCQEVYMLECLDIRADEQLPKDD